MTCPIRVMLGLLVYRMARLTAGVTGGWTGVDSPTKRTKLKAEDKANLTV
jgi:hypothetical protein